MSDTVQEPLSIVVPTLNEAGNLPRLLQRIDTAARSARIPYEVVLVDDHSTDDTIAVAHEAATHYPMHVYEKQGRKGKAHSLLEGFDHANHEIICMIDADLQYPPEAIGPMYEKLVSQKADVILTQRIAQKTSLFRRLNTGIFHFIFVRTLFGIDYDTQSGLKLFRKHILKTMKLRPSPWSFDLEFIVKSLERNYKILSYKIAFGKRFAGEAKVHVISTALELARASLRLHRETATKKVRRSYRKNNQLSMSNLSGLMIGSVACLAFVLFLSANSFAFASKYSVQNAVTGSSNAQSLLQRGEHIFSQVEKAFTQASPSAGTHKRAAAQTHASNTLAATSSVAPIQTSENTTLPPTTSSASLNSSKTAQPIVSLAASLPVSQPTSSTPSGLRASPSANPAYYVNATLNSAMKKTGLKIAYILLGIGGVMLFVFGGIALQRRKKIELITNYPSQRSVRA